MRSCLRDRAHRLRRSLVTRQVASCDHNAYGSAPNLTTIPHCEAPIFTRSRVSCSGRPRQSSHAQSTRWPPSRARHARLRGFKWTFGALLLKLAQSSLQNHRAPQHLTIMAPNGASCKETRLVTLCSELQCTSSFGPSVVACAQLCNDMFVQGMLRVECRLPAGSWRGQHCSWSGQHCFVVEWVLACAATVDTS